MEDSTLDIIPNINYILGYFQSSKWSIVGKEINYMVVMFVLLFLRHISFHLFFVLFIPNTTTLQTNGYIRKQPMMDEQTLKSHIDIHWLGENIRLHPSGSQYLCKYPFVKKATTNPNDAIILTMLSMFTNAITWSLYVTFDIWPCK